MKKSKIVLAICCIIAVIGAVTVSFAVWDTLAADSSTVKASFGKNVRVELINNNTFTNAGQNLVPKDAICGLSETQQYEGASFTVKLSDAASKSNLTFTLKVITDGDLDVSHYFDITITTAAEGASLSFDEEALKSGLFEGSIVVPPTQVVDGKTIPGEAMFNMDMSFKKGASVMLGIENIIGRTFKIKIDILAEKA